MCMCACTLSYVCANECLYICVCVPVLQRLDVYVRVCACMYACRRYYICMCLFERLCDCVCIYICVGGCVCVREPVVNIKINIRLDSGLNPNIHI